MIPCSPALLSCVLALRVPGAACSQGNGAALRKCSAGVIPKTTAATGSAHPNAFFLEKIHTSFLSPMKTRHSYLQLLFCCRCCQITSLITWQQLSQWEKRDHFHSWRKGSNLFSMMLVQRAQLQSCLGEDLVASAAAHLSSDHQTLVSCPQSIKN